MQARKHKNIEPVARMSPELLADNAARLRELFPECVTEGKIDFERLKAILGSEIDDRPERFTFMWAGKRDALRLLQIPSRATFVAKPKESVEFDTTSHLFIEAENLEALKLLYKPYFGSVKLIYIDPPYNTGNDFIYRDDFKDPLDAYLKFTAQKDASGNLMTSNPETGGRYHSAWLSMMYPRLFIARQLLREDGAIFVSIDDHEVQNLRMVMNEIFGEENFIATVIWQKVFSPKNTARHLSEDHDYIVIYARNATVWKPTLLPRTEEADARYENPDHDPRGPWSSSDLTARNYYSEGTYEVTSPSGKKFKPTIGTYWRVKLEKFKALDKDGRVWWGPNGSNMPRLKRYLSEVKQGIVPQTLWMHTEVGNTQEAKKELLQFVKFENTDNVLDTVKPTRLLQRILKIATTPNSNDVVLDFFAGSATTAHAVLKQNHEDGGNRRFICVQLPEILPVPEKRLKTITDIAKARITNVLSSLQHEKRSKLQLQEREDLGVRTFRLGESNYKQWTGVDETDPEAYAKTMKLFVDPLVPGWNANNVIWEVAIKEGYGLNARTEKLDVKSNTVFRVTDPDKAQTFYVCLDATLKDATLKNLSPKPDDLFVCLDAALNDATAANLALQCRLKTI